MTICYGLNNYIQRRELWEAKNLLSKSITIPWSVVGDFNVIRRFEEKCGGACPNVAGLNEFNDCIHETCLEDLYLSGSSCTWSNSGCGQSRIKCKLDRAMVNPQFVSMNLMHGEVLLPAISNHFPILLLKDDHIKPNTPFRYYNFWVKCDGFFLVVMQAWDCTGTPFFGVVPKLKRVKIALKERRKNQAPINRIVADAKYFLEDFQRQ